MRYSEIICESPSVLYHGTLLDNIPSIKAHGLNPKVGEIVTSVFAGESPPNLVFASDKREKPLVVIMTMISKRLDKPFNKVTFDEIVSMGAVVVIDRADLFQRAKRRGVPHVSLEPRDYYAEVDVHPSHFIVGDDLARFFSRWKMRITADNQKA